MMTLTHTRIMVHVSIEDDTGQTAALITALTSLISWLVSVGYFVTQAVLWANDLMEATRFTSAVFAIGFKSLAFGMGVKL